MKEFIGKKIFVIPCKYNPESPVIFNCIKSIRKFHNDPIVVVDSGSQEKQYISKLLSQYKKIYFEDIDNKSYVTGAVWHTFKKYEADNYIFLHDSTELMQNIDLILSQDVYVFFKSQDKFSWPWPYLPFKPKNKKDRDPSKRSDQWAKQQMKKTSIPFKDKGFSVAVGPMFQCKKEVLKIIDATNFSSIMPSTKGEQNSMEILWGMVFDHLGYSDIIDKNASSNMERRDKCKLLIQELNKEISVVRQLTNKKSPVKIVKYYLGRN